MSAHVPGERLDHGEFLPWIERNCEFSRQTADNYRRLYDHRNKLPTVSNLQDAYREVAQIESREKHIGMVEIAAEVRQGSRRDAQWYSFGANKAHGLRRAKGDAKRAIEKILTDPEWSKVPQTKIAEHVGVSREYVNRVSRDIGSSCDRSHDSERTVTRNGTTYTQNTENIGRREERTTTTTTTESVFYEPDRLDTAA